MRQGKSNDPPFEDIDDEDNCMGCFGGIFRKNRRKNFKDDETSNNKMSL